MLNSFKFPTRKFISLIFLFSSAPLLSTENNTKVENMHEAFSYIDVGVGCYAFPMIGLGHRVQSQKHGFDVSVQFATLIVSSQVKASFLYHYFPNPAPGDQFYLGAGLGLSGFFLTEH